MRMASPKLIFPVFLLTVICCCSVTANARLQSYSGCASRYFPGSGACAAHNFLHRNTSYNDTQRYDAANQKTYRSQIHHARKARRMQIRKPIQPGARKRRDKIKLPDEDEDEDSDRSFRKDRTDSGYFSRLFAATLPQYCPDSLPKTSPIYHHFLYSAACRYIALRVLRI